MDREFSARNRSRTRTHSSGHSNSPRTPFNLTFSSGHWSGNGGDGEDMETENTDVFGSSSADSPASKRFRSNADRFLPDRGGASIVVEYNLQEGPAGRRMPKRPPRKDGDVTAVLKNELFDDGTFPSSSISASMPIPPISHNDSPPRQSMLSGPPRTPTHSRTLSYTSPSKRTGTSSGFRLSHGGIHTLDSPTHSRYNKSPIKARSSNLLESPNKEPRQIAKVPFKVLDAPELADDFYLNLVDWSSTNVLGVGLATCVYLWSAQTSKVTKLCDLNDSEDSVTSINWVTQGSQIAVGTGKGQVQIWDAHTLSIVRTLKGHTQRVGTLAWNNNVLSSGSRDRSILHRDVRAAGHYMAKLTSHKQEVCGLKWNTADNLLASGGNDNKLYVWDGLHTTPLFKFTDHVAAVKAIAWSPHVHGILASGGGTLDKKIKFWNTVKGEIDDEIDTSSQVCNLMWSKNSNELVSTHGFSNSNHQNQICIWKYPSRQLVGSLLGHTFRVLYLAMSPCGQTIVTGAGDETLRFWTAFPKTKDAPDLSGYTLDHSIQLR
ncbi:WD40 repeat-like protein [Atractiella rhizophila]|nr:WD40 repeat-like protein [Atractiella rhizophila]